MEFSQLRQTPDQRSALEEWRCTKYKVGHAEVVYLKSQGVPDNAEEMTEATAYRDNAGFLLTRLHGYTHQQIEALQAEAEQGSQSA